MRGGGRELRARGSPPCTAPPVAGLLGSYVVSVGLQRLLLTGETPLSLGIFPLRIRSPFSASKGETRLACPRFSPTRSGIAVRFRGMD